MSSTCSSPPNGKRHRCGDAPATALIPYLRRAGLSPKEVLEGQPSETAWRVHRTTGPMYSRGMPCVNSDRICDRTSSRFRGPSIPVTASGTALRAPEGRRRRHFGRHGTDRHRGGPYPTGVRFTRVLRLPDVSGIGGGVWATRVGGGNHALYSAPHRLSRQWARTIHRAHTDPATSCAVATLCRIQAWRMPAIPQRTNSVMSSRDRVSGTACRS